MSKRNVELAHRWFEEVWNQGRLEAIDEMASPEAKGQGQLHHGPPINLQQFRQFAEGLHKAFPGLHVVIEDTIDSKDLVVLRWHADMTHRGSFMGVEPTGRDVRITGITIFRYVRGKLVQGWDNWDQLGLLAQIGAVPERFAPIAA
jgi:predicted ester cyclase